MDGVWRTVSGRRIFIEKGQSLSDAMKKSNKFNSKKEIEIKNNKTIKKEWNANNKESLSKMNSSQMAEEIRSQLKDSGIGDSFTINGNTTGYFYSRKDGLNNWVVKIQNTTNDKFNSKITSVKINKAVAKTTHEKEVIKSLQKKFNEYL